MVSPVIINQPTQQSVDLLFSHLLRYALEQDAKKQASPVDGTGDAPGETLDGNISTYSVARVAVPV